ncbi:MAG: O-antigen ligase family protein [Planctomycetia bacterium]|nr:O-antigen ligase family protein [Planctomycetia bacterium]
MKKKSVVLSNPDQGKAQVSSPFFDRFSFVSCLLFPIALVCSMVLAPEGAFREGEFLSSGLLVFLSLFFLSGSVFLWIRKSPDREFRFHRADGIVLLLFLWCAIVYLFAVDKESVNLRFASNMFWIQALMYSVYFYFRLLSPDCFRKHLPSFLMVIFSIVIAESLFSVYAYTVRDPAFRKAWIKEGEALLIENGMNYPPGSPERIMLENRIMGSTEPLGTYGLTNTLAGLLVPWTVLSVSLFFRFLLKGIEVGFRNRMEPQKKGAFGACLLTGLLSALMFGSLVLTKSRTGIIAFLFGLGIVFFGFLLYRGLAPENRKRLFLLGGSFLLLFFGGILLAFTFGLIDREVFTEAGKSLGYRLEYWITSLKMIADHPFFGIGPGNFQTMYPYYMLSQSSEIVADPHNFAFEIATNFGIPALILFLLFAAQIGILFFKKGSPEESDSTEYRLSRPALIGGFLGGIVVFLVSFITSAPVDYFFIFLFWIALAFCAGIFVLANKTGFSGWLRKTGNQKFTLLLLLGGAGSILLNLCAAGGIFYPAVIFPFWIIAAIMVNRDCREPKTAKKRFYLIPLIMIGSFFLFAACFFTAQKPMLAGKFLTMELESDLHSKNFRPEMLLSDSLWNADPWSIPLGKMRYELLLDACVQMGGNMNQTSWERSREHLIRITPHSASTRFMMGDRELTHYTENKDPKLLALALEDLRQAVEFGPQDARVRMIYAKALLEAGQKNLAVKEIRRALDLDDQMVHKDRKLPEDLRKFGESVK